MTLETRRRQLRQAAAAEPYRVLLPLSNLPEAEVLLPLAEALVEMRQGQLIILHVVPVPEGHALSEAAATASQSRQTMDYFLAARGQTHARVKTVVRVAREIWEGIWETVDQEKIDLLFLGWSSETLPQTAVDSLTHQRLSNPPCEVVVVRPGTDLIGPQGWQMVRRVLLPVRGTPQDALALRLSLALAEITQASITLLHATGQAPRDAEEKLFAAFGPALRNLERLTRSITVVGEVSQAIIEEADHHHVVVMGASTRSLAPGEWSGPILDAVAEAVNCTIIVTKSNSHVISGQPEQEPGAALAPPEPRQALPSDLTLAEPQQDRPVAVVVDKWFAENTFFSHEFAHLDRLVELKEKQGLTISLGLPALNEEETVGRVIQTIQRALMEQVPLLDEIVLIDSGSVDYTREIAADLGIPVYIHQEILPQYGAFRGKGEALWKSLYILNGDIVAWIDTDIRNIHPRFVFGVLGPLLRDPGIQYVKGFYRRPLRQGNKIVAGGGGRVTELTARPLINLFFPELSGLIQPLSGEYAGRRQALESLPFFTGYGVETGLLIDVLESFGLPAIAQVDLLERVHHNQSLGSLSQMSFAILQVVIRRLEERYKIRLVEEVNKTMNLIHYEPSRFYLEMVEIVERERPPLITLPEYRRKRGLSPEAGRTTVRERVREAAAE